MAHSTPPLKIKVQIYSGDEIAMGPGKADLLDAIAREGSISAAGRALGMSYRRTWLLVDVMNRLRRDRGRISGSASEDRISSSGSLPSGFPEKKGELSGGDL